MIMDIKTGEMYPLTKGSVKENVLINDKGLLKKFENANPKKDELEDWIEKFNKAHPISF